MRASSPAAPRLETASRLIAAPRHDRWRRRRTGFRHAWRCAGFGRAWWCAGVGHPRRRTSSLLGGGELVCVRAFSREEETTKEMIAVQMPTIIVSVDLECGRCRAKIQKVLNRIQEKGEFCIDDIDFDEKNNKVKVTGPFDPDKLADKLCCKACKIIKQIEIVEPPPPPPPPKKEEPAPPPTEKKKEPAPPPSAKVEEPPKEKPPPPKEEPPKEKPAPPPPKVVQVPYPWPYPYPYPAWPSDCCCHHGHGGCHCCSCGKAPEPTPAPTPPPPQYYPQYVPQPYPCNPWIVCEEDPPYACAIM